MRFAIMPTRSANAYATWTNKSYIGSLLAMPSAFSIHAADLSISGGSVILISGEVLDYKEVREPPGTCLSYKTRLSTTSRSQPHLCSVGHSSLYEICQAGCPHVSSCSITDSSATPSTSRPVCRDNFQYFGLCHFNCTRTSYLLAVR